MIYKGREHSFYQLPISNTMQSFNQYAKELLNEMLPQSSVAQVGRPGLKPKLQFSEDDMMDPEITNLVKQAKGDPTMLAKLRPKLIQGLRNRRLAYLKQAQQELKTLAM